MTLIDKIEKESSEKKDDSNIVSESKKVEKQERKSTSQDSSESTISKTLSEVEQQFKNMMSEFNANGGFSVDTGEQPSDAMLEILSAPNVIVSITLLMSYIRYCVNHGIKKDITVKIGYNKPPSIPMNFAINEELLEDIYPGDTVEIN